MERVVWVRLIVVAGFAWGLHRSRKAWGRDRLAPPAPLVANLPPEPGLYPYLFPLLAGVAVWPALTQPLVALVVYLCLYDWTRFRPWVYQHSALLLALSLCPAEQALNIGRLITVSIYFWSGVLKVNRMFVELVFPWILQPLLKGRAKWLGYLAPILEAAMGVGLLFPALRPWALAAAVAMHLVILFCFSRFGHRTHKTIWPWNVSMLLADLVFFAATPQVGPLGILFSHPVALALFGLLPALGLFNRLDPVFSHGHMTGRHIFASLALSRRLWNRLPSELRLHCVRNGHLYTLDVSEWYMRDVGLPPPQQERLLCAVARDFARHGAGPNDLTLTVFRMPSVNSRSYPHKVYSGAELWSVNSRH